MLLCVFFVKSEPKQTKGHLYHNQTGLIDFLSFYHIQNSITGEEESLVTKDIYNTFILIYYTTLVFEVFSYTWKIDKKTIRALFSFYYCKPDHNRSDSNFKPKLSKNTFPVKLVEQNLKLFNGVC